MPATTQAGERAERALAEEQRRREQQHTGEGDRRGREARQQPPQRVMAATMALLVTVQAARVRDPAVGGLGQPPGDVDGVADAVAVTSANWTAITNARPPAPGPTNASRLDQQARARPGHEAAHGACRAGPRAGARAARRSARPDTGAERERV